MAEQIFDSNNPSEVVDGENKQVVGEDLKKLYDAVSTKFNIGDLESFSSKMKTPEDRKSFYDKVKEGGFDLGDFESYEQRLAGEQVVSDDAASPVLEDSPIEEDEEVVKSSVNNKKVEKTQDQIDQEEIDYNNLSKLGLTSESLDASLDENQSVVSESTSMEDAANRAQKDAYLYEKQQVLDAKYDEKVKTVSSITGYPENFVRHFNMVEKAIPSKGRTSDYIVGSAGEFDRGVAEVFRTVDGAIKFVQRGVVQGINLAERAAGKKESQLTTVSDKPTLWSDIADTYDQVADKGYDVPDDIIGDVAGGLARMIPDLAITAFTPAMKLSKVSQVTRGAINAVPKFPTVLAVKEGVHQASENQDDPFAIVKGAAKGFEEGLVMEAMGLVGKEVKMMADGLGAGAAMSETGAAVTNGTLFGAHSLISDPNVYKDGDVDWELAKRRFATGFGTGLAFHLKGIAEGVKEGTSKSLNISIANSAIKRGYAEYMTADRDAIRKSLVDVKDPRALRKVSNEYWRQAEMSTSEVEKNQYLMAKTGIDNMLSRKMFAEYVANNPEEMKRVINEDKSLSPNDVDNILKKIDETVEDYEVVKSAKEEEIKADEPIETEKVDAKGLQSKLDEMKESDVDVADIKIEDIEAKYKEFKAEKETKEKTPEEITEVEEPKVETVEDKVDETKIKEKSPSDEVDYTGEKLQSLQDKIDKREDDLVEKYMKEEGLTEDEATRKYLTEAFPPEFSDLKDLVNERIAIEDNTIAHFANKISESAKDLGLSEGAVNAIKRSVKISPKTNKLTTTDISDITDGFKDSDLNKIAERVARAEMESKGLDYDSVMGQESGWSKKQKMDFAEDIAKKVKEIQKRVFTQEASIVGEAKEESTVKKIAEDELLEKEETEATGEAPSKKTPERLVKKAKEAAQEGKDVVSTKQSRLGARMLLDETNLPESSKTKVKELGIDKYEPQSDVEAADIAANLFKHNPIEVVEAVYRNKNVAPNIRTSLMAKAIKYETASIEKYTKEGNIDKADERVEKQIEILRELTEESVNLSRGLRSLGSAEMVGLLAPYTQVRVYKKSINKTRDLVQKRKSFIKKETNLKEKASKMHKDAIDKLIDTPEFKRRIAKLKADEKVVKKVQPSKEKIAKIKQHREELKKQWLKEKKSTLSSTIIPGLTGADIEFGSKIAVTYVEEGYVRAYDIAKKLIKDFKDMGVELSQDDALKLVPKEVDGKKLSDLEKVEETDRAARLLAKKIFGEVSEAKEVKDDPMRQMVSTLLGKFKERNVDTDGATKQTKTSIEKIAEAIKDKETYSEAWIEARDKALEKIRDNKDTTDSEKEIMSKKVEKAYKTATEFTFTENQVKEAVRKKARDLDVKIKDVVKSHYSKQAAVGAMLKESLIEEAGLSGADAEVLSKSIDRAYTSLLSGKAKDLVNKFIDKKVLKKSTSDVASKRQTSVDELIGLINANAFDSAKFREAFSDAYGLPVISDAFAKKLKLMSEAVQLLPSGAISKSRTEDMMGELANQSGMDVSELMDYIWYSHVLSGMTTQLRNTVSAQNNVLMALGVETGGNPVKAHIIAKGIKRGYTRGFDKAKHIMATGKVAFESKAEMPNLGERVHFAGIIGFINSYKYLLRFMNSSDQVGVSVGVEGFINKLAYEAIDVNNFKYMRSRKYRKKINDMVEEHIMVDKGSMDGFKKQAAEEAETYFLTDKEQKIRILELVDESRDAVEVEESVTFAERLTGNTKTYGHVGAIVDLLAKAMQLSTTVVTKTGKRITIPWFPIINRVAAFTRIPANITTSALEFVPVVGGAALLTGKYGAGTEKLFGNRYVRELSNEQKSSIKKRQVAGALAMGVIYALSEPDDDGDSYIGVTANGTGDYTKNKALGEDWAPYSIRIGEAHIGYKYTPFYLPMAIIGYMRDAKYRPDDKDKSQAELLANAFYHIKNFVLDMTVVSNMGKLFEAIVESGGDLGAAGNKMSKLIISSAKAYIAPGNLRDVEAIFDFIAQNPQKQNSTLYDRIISKAPVAKVFLHDGRSYAVDVLGRDVKTNPPWYDFITFAKRDELLNYHFKQTPKSISIPYKGSVEFNLTQKDGGMGKRPLTNGLEEENELWYRFMKARGKLIAEGIRDAISDGYKGDEYIDFMAKRTKRATEDARREVELLTFDKPVETLIKK